MTCAECGLLAKRFRAVPITGTNPAPQGPLFRLVCASCAHTLIDARGSSTALKTAKRAVSSKKREQRSTSQGSVA